MMRLRRVCGNEKKIKSGVNRVNIDLRSSVVCG